MPPLIWAYVFSCPSHSSLVEWKMNKIVNSSNIFSSRIFLILCLTLFGPLVLPEGPTNSSLSVRPSVMPLFRIRSFLFLIFCMRLGFSKHKKYRKVFIMSKIGHLDSKSVLSSFPLNLFTRFFWSHTWWQTLRRG